MAITTLRHTLKGQTTVEAYYSSAETHDDKHDETEAVEDDDDDDDARYICVPNDGERRVYKVLPSEKLYDFGSKENLRDFLAQDIFPDCTR